MTRRKAKKQAKAVPDRGRTMFTLYPKPWDRILEPLNVPEYMVPAVQHALDIGDAVSFTVVMTPEKATHLLGYQVKNRDLAQGSVDAYTQDILANRFLQTHQGVAMDSNGHLYDGQHRLWAIIQAKRAVPITVSLNHPPDSVSVTDQGKVRSLGAVLKIEGRAYTNAELATMTALLFLPGSQTRRVTVGEARETMAWAEEAVRFACHHLGGRGLDAAVRAVFARAWFTQDREMLASLAYALRSGTPSMGDGRALWMLYLRAYLARVKGKGSPMLTERFLKTRRALYGALKGEPPAEKLYPMEREPFPVPSEAVPF